MSCRTTPAGSAFTTYARLVAAGGTLSDPAVLSTFHDLRRTYTQRDEDTRRTYTRDEYLGLIDRQRQRVRRANLSDARRDSILERLDAAAAADTPPQDVLYALHNLTPTVRARSASLSGYLRETADRMGVSYAEAEARFREIESSVPRTRARTAPDGYTDASVGLADRIGVGRDMGVVTALARLNEEADAVETARARALPQRIDTRTIYVADRAIGMDQVWLDSAGYDPSDGRLEVDIISGLGTDPQRMAYRGVPASVWQAMNAPGASPGRVWADQVRANPSYAYPTERDAAMAGVAGRCGQCGQFATSGHSCPITATPVSLSRWSTTSRWSRQAYTATRWQMDYSTTPPSRTEQEVEASMPLPAIREFRTAVAAGPVTVSDINTGISDFAEVAGPTGQPVLRSVYARVHGDITVARDEDGGLAFNTARLRCTCPAYQANSHCPHVDEHVEAIRARLDPPSRPRSARQARTPEEREAILREAQARADAAAASDWTRTEAGLAEARATWRAESDVLYSEDPAAFQADVEAAVARKDAGQPPVPYMTSDALDGMAARGSGQAFGMEIEFDMPREMTWNDRNQALQRIATELHEAGLTGEARQLGYGASRRLGFRDTHTDAQGNGTWSFESDGSVSGGELVTPGMYDEPETWQKLAKACEIIKRNGGIASTKAGAHVHVGTGGYAGDTAAYTELARTVSQHEDVLYRLASSTERGTHRNNGYSRTSPAVPDAGFADASRIRTWQGHSKYVGVNYAGVAGTDADHPEFRLFDSTLDPGTMQAQIKLAVGLTHAAQRNAAAGGTTRGKEEWGSHKKRAQARGTRRGLSAEEFAADTATTRSLLDTVFRRREDKAQLASVFACTKWIAPRRGR